MANSIPLEIPKHVYDQIRFLCSEISEVEWSGVLFYSVEGSIRNWDSLKLKVEHIYPMHKGTAGYTEYSYDDNLVEFRMKNPHTLKWKLGHVHSHNNMSVFFSGTDQSELEDNSPLHNYYLSLIVNNRMEMTAKVAMVGEVPNYQCTDESGEKFDFEIEAPKKTMFIFDCDITVPGNNISVEDSFIERTREIIAISDTNKAKFDASKKSTGIDNPLFDFKNRKTPGFKREFQTRFDKLNKKETGSHLDERPLWQQVNEAKEVFFRGSDTKRIPEAYTGEDFARVICRMGDGDITLDTLDDAITDLAASDRSYFDFVEHIILKYPEYYDEYWPKGKDFGMDHFLEATEDVISELEEYMDEHKFIEELITGLQLMIARIEKQSKTF